MNIHAQHSPHSYFCAPNPWICFTAYSTFISKIFFPSSAVERRASPLMPLCGLSGPAWLGVGAQKIKSCEMLAVAA
jgi:hypothetical protein